MVEEDDLGAFFSEIEQIEKVIPIEENILEDGKVGKVEEREVGKEEETKIEMKVSAPIEIVAKPQIIVRQPERNYSTITTKSTDLNKNDHLEEVSVFEKSSTSFTIPEVSVIELRQKVPQPYIPIQKDKKYVRSGGGEVWVDPTLNEWPENDFRIFVGDLGNEVTTDLLAKEFQCYPSFAKAKVIRDGWNSKSRGFGFVSFLDPFDCAKAIREKNGKYLGYRPMRVRKSTWQEMNQSEVRKKENKKRKINESLGLT